MTAPHTLEVRAVRPTIAERRSVCSPDLVIGPSTLGYYLACTGCEAADPTTHETSRLAEQTGWRHS